MNEEVALIVGRSVSDYAACGQQMPVGVKIVPCVTCGDRIALGATGQASLATGPLSLVFCTPCMRRLASKRIIKASDAITSPDLQEQFRRNPGLEKQVTDLIQSLVAK